MPGRIRQPTRALAPRQASQLKLRSLALSFAFLSLLLQNILVPLSPLFSYLDEGTAALLILWALLSTRTSNPHQPSPATRIAVLSLIGFILITLSGNFIYGIQESQPAIIIDLFSSIRFFAAFYCGIGIVHNDPEPLRLFQQIARILLLVLFVFTLANLVTDIGMSFELRYGFRAFTFLYQHPTMLSASVVACISVLMVDLRRNGWLVIIGALVLIATLRSKSVAFAVIAIAVVFYYQYRPRLSFLSGSFISLLAFLLGYSQIQVYFGGSETARSALLMSSIGVASRFFPFGAGFATYGSNASLSPYSPLYEEIGFTHIYGLTPDDPRYLADSFWPMIIGQGGWIGLSFIVLTTAAFTIDASLKASSRHVLVWAGLSIPTYLAISSLSEAAYFSTYSTLLGLTAAVVLTTSPETMKGSTPSSQFSTTPWRIT